MAGTVTIWHYTMYPNQVGRYAVQVRQACWAQWYSHSGMIPDCEPTPDRDATTFVNRGIAEGIAKRCEELFPRAQVYVVEMKSHARLLEGVS